MVTRFDQHGLEATPEQLLDEKLGGKSKFKQAFFALSVHYYLQKFDQEDGMQNIKSQELLNRIKYNFNTDGGKFEDLNENVDEFFKNAHCCVNSMNMLGNLKGSGDQGTKFKIYVNADDTLEERK